MSRSSVCDTYISQIDSLKTIVQDANTRIIQEVPDEFVYNNANFFTKSFLVILCAYIESYLKDILMVVINDYKGRIAAQKIPHNLIKWSFSFQQHLEEKEVDFKDFSLDIKKKDLDKFISANPYLAARLFTNFGIKLRDDTVFESQQEFVNNIVLKRNKVVHHNDDASDLTNTDLLSYIDKVEEYVVNIDSVVIGFLNR